MTTQPTSLTAAITEAIHSLGTDAATPTEVSTWIAEFYPEFEYNPSTLGTLVYQVRKKLKNEGAATTKPRTKHVKSRVPNVVNEEVFPTNGRFIVTDSEGEFVGAGDYSSMEQVTVDDLKRLREVARDFGGLRKLLAAAKALQELTE